MKRLAIILGLTVLTACNNQDPLVGTWVRFGDKYEGMTIKVSKEGESFKGIIIASPDSCVLDGFVIGDVKWKSIKQTGENKYEFESLAKTKVLFSDKFDTEYSLSYLELVTDDELKTRKFSKGREAIGTKQKWKRVKEN